MWLIITVLSILIVYLILTYYNENKHNVRVGQGYVVRRNGSYFTLYVKNGWFTEPVGENVYDDLYGLDDFVLYKFNSVNQAEQYYDSILKNKSKNEGRN